jgi:hypothetical protein
MTEDELQVIEERRDVAARCWDDDPGPLVEFVAEDVPALVAEVRRLRNTLGVARGALADIAHMSELELRDVAARKAERIYDETK